MASAEEVENPTQRGKGDGRMKKGKMKGGRMNVEPRVGRRGLPIVIVILLGCLLVLTSCVGPTGAPGPAGPPGPKGDTGPQGPPGTMEYRAGSVMATTRTVVVNFDEPFVGNYSVCITPTNQSALAIVQQITNKTSTGFTVTFSTIYTVYERNENYTFDYIAISAPQEGSRRSSP